MSTPKNISLSPQNPTSMLYWYPIIKDLPIPQPKTMFVLLSEKELKHLYNEEILETVTDKIKVVCKTMFYPCFLRTDLASGKHHWKDSCFVDDEAKIQKHVFEVVESNLMADITGLDFKAFAVREYIPMDSKFTAFYGDMPVNPERRYFVKDGTVVCHHPYWVEEAIEESKTPSAPNWRELSKEMNIETESEISLLTNYALMVTGKLSGAWSVDFCKAKDGRWILIDLAVANRSWHPQNCPHLVKNRKVSS
jgi:hypothetical protein